MHAHSRRQDRTELTCSFLNARCGHSLPIISTLIELMGGVHGMDVGFTMRPACINCFDKDNKLTVHTTRAKALSRYLS
eukprot:2280346-Amphidinium_carterae.2